LPSVQQWRRGRAARLGSAKAPTPVRIRTMPLKPLKQFRGFFISNFLEKLSKDILRIRTIPLKQFRGFLYLIF
jgi:hypothetical protein